MNEYNQIVEINTDVIKLQNDVCFEVTDHLSFSTATDLLKAIKVKIKQTDDARKVLTKPINDHIKMINAKFAPIIEELERLKISLDDKMCKYLAQERIRKETEEREKLAKEAEILRKQAEDEKMLATWSDNTDEKGEHEVNALIAKSQANRLERQEVVINNKDICVSGNFATSSVRKSWVYEIIDINKIPLIYLEPSDRLIKEAVKGGARAIDGLKIFEKETIVSR
jgi:Skp family chaperone for outer membrane proteins